MSGHDPHGFTRTREVDQFGNVAYAIFKCNTLYGSVLKTCSGWQAETPWGSYAPVVSVKAGEAWLERSQAARKLPPDPRTVAEMIPVRRAELAAHAGEDTDCPNGHGPMPPRPLESQTYEQMWCGLWWDCEQCACSRSYLSRELAAYHGEPYVIRDGEHEMWNGREWVTITQAQFDTYWRRRLAQTERSRRDMNRQARASRRGQKAGAQ